MIEVHKLLNKCNKFMLSYHKCNGEEYYNIELTLSTRFWASVEEIQEYDDFFNTSRNKHSWRFYNEEEAKSKYTWAVLKWNNDVS